MPNTKPIPTERDPVRAALADIRKLCDENLGPSRSSLLSRIAHIADETLNAPLPPTLNSGAVREALERFAKRADDHAPYARDDTIVHFRLRDCRIARAALALPRAVDGGAWQPIETAPLDGTRILLFQGARGAFEGWWHDDWPHAEHYWMDDQDSEPDPTHWRPTLAVPRSYRPCPSSVPGDGK